MGSPVQEQFEGPLEMQHEWHSGPPQQIGLQAGGSTASRDGLYAIPDNLTPRQRMMLRITEDEARHGAVHTIKCRFCPDVALGSFCDQCGDHFARPDSKNRHASENRVDCRKTLPDDAKWKKREIKWNFDIFNARFEHCLRTGEELGKRFAEIAHESVPSTSKKAPKDKETGSRGDSQ